MKSLSHASIVGASVGRWARPVDWLPLPMPSPGEQKVLLLMPVWEHGSNYASLSCSGKFTVDWGDGSAPEDAAGDTYPQHLYDWGDIAPETLTSEGFRQVIITVTNQVGFNITALNVTSSHTDTNGTSTNTNVYRELVINLPFATSLALSGGRGLKQCRAVTIGEVALTTCAVMFSGDKALEYVSDFDTSGVLNFASMFSECAGLRRAPNFDTSAGTNFSSMFAECQSLEYVPAYDMREALNVSAMFSQCNSIIVAPRLTLGKVTDASGMFSNCNSLRSVPAMDFSTVLNGSFLFGSCRSLVDLPPTLDFSSATTLAGLFSQCRSLRTIPELTTSVALVTTSTMFYYCTCITDIPLFETGGVLNAGSMFVYCHGLSTLPAFDLSAATDLSDLMVGCLRIGEILATGIKSTIVIPCSLRADKLDALYTSLAVVVGQTITVTGNPGTTGDDPTIATAKGWTVTG